MNYRRYRGHANAARYDPRSWAEDKEERALLQKYEEKRKASQAAAAAAAAAASPEAIRQALSTPADPIGSADAI